MGIDSCGMLLPAVNNKKDSDDEELHLLMVDNHIPAGAKLYWSWNLFFATYRGTPFSESIWEGSAFFVFASMKLKSLETTRRGHCTAPSEDAEKPLIFGDRNSWIAAISRRLTAVTMAVRSAICQTAADSAVSGTLICSIRNWWNQMDKNAESAFLYR